MGFSAYITTNTNLVDDTIIVYPNSNTGTYFDIDGVYATGTGIFTVPISGLYYLSHNESLEIQAGSNIHVEFHLNGAAIPAGAATYLNPSVIDPAFVYGSHSFAQLLTVGDQITVVPNIIVGGGVIDQGNFSALLVAQV